MAEPASLFTVGHSNHSAEHFLSLLRAHNIQGIADVRSWPASRYTPWFDSQPLAATLRAAGVQYVYLGSALGGRPREQALYDDDGRVRYDALARSQSFTSGLARLRRGIATLRIAAMCAEENPQHCHRRLLVARVLFEAGTPVLHIRGDTSLETEVGFTRPDSLFEEPLPWRSTASVSRKPRPSIFSAA